MRNEAKRGETTRNEAMFVFFVSRHTSCFSPSFHPNSKQGGKLVMIVTMMRNFNGRVGETMGRQEERGGIRRVSGGKEGEAGGKRGEACE